MEVAAKGRLRRWGAQACYLTVGGLGYGGLELLYRGFTHVSMLLTGGICFVLLVRLSRMEGHGILLLALLGGSGITTVELAVGCVVNLWLGLDVWDYSQELLHLGGQVCPKFFLYWCLLCVPIFYLCRWWRQGVAALRRRAHRVSFEALCASPRSFSTRPARYKRRQTGSAAHCPPARKCARWRA